MKAEVKIIEITATADEVYEIAYMIINGLLSEYKNGLNKQVETIGGYIHRRSSKLTLLEELTKKINNEEMYDSFIKIIEDDLHGEDDAK